MEYLEMPTGKKTEKKGTLLTDVSHSSEKSSDSELLERIDNKLDTLIAATKEKEE